MALLILCRICVAVTARAAPATEPATNFPPIELLDTQREAAFELAPTLNRGLVLTAPTEETRTVILADAVVGEFVKTKLLINNETWE